MWLVSVLYLSCPALTDVEALEEQFVETTVVYLFLSLPICSVKTKLANLPIE